MVKNVLFRNRKGKCFTESHPFLKNLDQVGVIQI